MKPLYFCFFWATAVLAVAQTSRAQTIPGRWYKVALPQAGNVRFISFTDSLNGTCQYDNGKISSTSDGGRTWALDTLTPIDTSTIPNVNEVNYGFYSVLAQKMYDSTYGFRLVEYVDSHDQSQYDDSVVIIETHDGWNSSSIYGSAYVITLPDTTYIEAHAKPMSDGYIVDSNDVWTAVGRSSLWTGSSFYNAAKMILHTSNGGVTWQSFNAFDSARYRPSVQNFLVNPTTHEVYCVLQNSTIDYAYSSDYGTIWQLDSTFSGSDDWGQTWRNSPVRGILWQLSNPAPGMLWAMLGQLGPGANYWNGEIEPTLDVRIGPNFYSRKLAYSSDNGATWLIDSTTFINDSLEEMHWLDARHGWIASWSHDSLFMWYYDADGNAGVVDHYLTNPFEFMVYPNPARNWVALKGATGSDVVVSDALGRAWYCPRVGMRLDISQLPAGVYFISQGWQHTRFAKE